MNLSLVPVNVHFHDGTIPFCQIAIIHYHKFMLNNDQISLKNCDDFQYFFLIQTAKICAAGESLTFGDMGSRPYKWAQHLAGIDFLPELPPSREMTYHESLKNDDLSSGLTMYRHQNRVQTILLKIRSRKQAQMALL